MAAGSIDFPLDAMLRIRTPFLREIEPIDPNG